MTSKISHKISYNVRHHSMSLLPARATTHKPPLKRQPLASLSLNEIARKHPVEWIKFHAGLLDLHSRVIPPPPAIRDITVSILWGNSGTGKTHRVRTSYPGCCLIQAGRDPFASYQTQETIFFDEFNYEKWTIQQMNLYLDKWPLELDCRYKNKHAYWTKVFICANSTPYNWWPLEHQALREAFWRRCTHIQEITSIEQDIPI